MAVNGERTMQPEPDMPNLTSPRVQAAMRVLGVLPEELERKMETATSEGDQRKLAMFERKRRSLIEEIHLLSSAGSTGVGVSPSGSQSLQRKHSTFLNKVLEAERATMEKMEIQAKKDVQKVVIQELETKLVMQQGAKRLADGEARLNKLIKDRDEKLKAMRKEAQKKSERTADVRMRAVRQQERDAEHTMEQLAEATQRAEGKMRALDEARAEARQQSAEKLASVQEKQHTRVEGELHAREYQYETIMNHHADTMGRLQKRLQSRQSQSEEMLQKQQSSMMRVREKWESKQREIQENYFNNLSRHEKAREKRETAAQEYARNLSKANSKVRSAFESRYERVQRDLERREPDKRLTQSASSLASLEKSLSESQVLALEQRRHYFDLAASNRDRLQRAHYNSQEQQLGKLQGMRDRVDALLDSKIRADDRRMVMQRNCAVQKYHLEHEMFKVKSAPPDKMAGMLRDLQPEPRAAERIQELQQQLGMQPAAGDEAAADR